MSDHIVASEKEISAGGCIVTHIEGREIAIYRIDDEFFAYTNWCPHQGGPACNGNLSGKMDACFDSESLEQETQWMRDGEIIVCPWHSWEFDVRTGENLARKTRLISHPVRIEDGEVVVSI